MSPSGWNHKTRRSRSCRSRTNREPVESHRQNIERIQRRFEKELNRSERELRWAEENLDDGSVASRRYIANLRNKVKYDYNQLMQEKVHEVEKCLSEIYDEERELSEQKLREQEIENERFHRQTVNQIIRERDAMCEEKLARQQSLYNKLLNEQAIRLQAQQRLQTFESLNISQMKDRLTRVEQSNYLLRRSVYDLIDHQQPVYRSTVYIPSDKQETDVTATMTTIVPHVKRVTSASTKKKIVAPVTDMVTSKPIRHLAILPPAKEQAKKEFIKRRSNLSETFNMYDGPTTTPTVKRSLDETLTINFENNESQVADSKCQIPIHIELKTGETNVCDNTTLSSVCELADQVKLQQKPHSLIGRYQLPNANRSSTPTPPVHVANVNYDEIQTSEVTDKQILIKQFYAQLEKMKTTFGIEQTHPVTTKNVLTLDSGEVTQTSTAIQLKDNATETCVLSATAQPENKKPPVPKKQTTTKTTSCRIKSAPVTMATQLHRDKNSHRVLSCKQQKRPTEKNPTQEKKSIHIKANPKRNTESAPLTRIDIHGPEITLLPHDEQECQQMYEKLQRLQPNGVCVDLNTLRRALYPPVGTANYSPNLNNHEQASAFKSYRQRTEEIPQSWIKGDHRYVNAYVSKQQSESQVKSNESNQKIASDSTNIDRITDQVKKHAAINYSYYTRTK
ncbi:unnamed protein product [Rotaria magnacalcarata]|uniref:Uncharacterized protein n=3 Tax=Rotaria magnacalcarata TaxID=392030 RepID=A0A819CRW9_9BILA|nr:unnamed protein product [Rotaria magnacalcarata]CAF4147748.1 unnamed protein product [Rotaria magnacalcarata]